MRFTPAAALGSALSCAASISTTQAAECARDAKGNCKPINKTCDHLDNYQIDWDCIFGPDSLEEVHERGGKFTTCPGGTAEEPCSIFIVTKGNERSEVKVQEGPEGFPFLKGEEYIFKYSFRAVDGMEVTNKFTHLGQLKGSACGYMVKGDPIYSLTANNKGLQVRFSNKESIEDFYPGMDDELDWQAANGESVHVKITTVFGESMEVEISGPVSGKAVWPSDLKPVAWYNDSEMVRMKLGLYHSTHNVADGDVEYQNISIEEPSGIIRTSPELDDGSAGSGNGQCTIDNATGQCEKVDITCEALTGNQIDWECVFGPGTLDDVHDRGGAFTTCPKATKLEPCSRFIVEKEAERSKVKVKEGPEGFGFLYGETYIFKYSFRAVEDMKVAKSFTHLGQLKGSQNSYMVSGVPIYLLTANNDGLMVRFSNLESIENFHYGFEEFLSWEDATGEWVNVEIITTFGSSMEVIVSGAVNGRAVWPSNLKPVACHNGGTMVRMKLGLYHSTNNVADGECWCGGDDSNLDKNSKTPTCDYPCAGDGDETCGGYSALSLYQYGGTPTEVPEGTKYLGCYRDNISSRALSGKLGVNDNMTHEMCSEFCGGFNAKFFGLSYSKECFCGLSSDQYDWYGTATCDMKCAGDSSLTCGGSLAVSLYLAY